MQPESPKVQNFVDRMSRRGRIAFYVAAALFAVWAAYALIPYW